jgi:hypothetical protein
MIAFRRQEDQKGFYAGYSLTHRNDLLEDDNMDREIAFEIAKGRAIEWVMTPCSAKKIPESIKDQFKFFIHRSMKYFRTDTIPEWMKCDIEEFQKDIDRIYDERDESKKKEIDRLEYLIDECDSKRVSLLAQLMKLTG